MTLETREAGDDEIDHDDDLPDHLVLLLDERTPAGTVRHYICSKCLDLLEFGPRAHVRHNCRHEQSGSAT